MTITIITYLTLFLMGMVAGMFLKDHQHYKELEAAKSSRRFWQSRAQVYQSQYNALIDRTYKLNVLKFKAETFRDLFLRERERYLKVQLKHDLIIKRLTDFSYECRNAIK